MNREPESAENSSWSSLVSGICIDAAQLLAHELELAKLEVQSEIRSVKASVGLLLLGLSIATVGLLLILVMLAYRSQREHDGASVGLFRHYRHRDLPYRSGIRDLGK